jgi:L-lactate dehydrogenase complex protein LldF
MAATRSQAMHFHARAGEKVRNAALQRTLQKAKPLFVAKRVKGMASLADDGLILRCCGQPQKHPKSNTF